MNALKKIWPAYLTAFVIACSVTVGFVLGVIFANGMALNAISKFEKDTREAILERANER